MNRQLNGLIREERYRLYHSPYIVSYQKEIIESCEHAYKNYNTFFKYNNKGTTWDYKTYNIFSLAVNSVHFYVIYQQIVAAVREFVGDDRPLWMESWMNHHRPDEVLDWHDHHSMYTAHGYISIDPKNTVTEFNTFSIENKPGNLYLGIPGRGMEHRVVVREPYEGYRITLAFNILGIVGSQHHDYESLNLSYIPIP